MFMSTARKKKDKYSFLHELSFNINIYETSLGQVIKRALNLEKLITFLEQDPEKFNLKL